MIILFLLFLCFNIFSCEPLEFIKHSEIIPKNTECYMGVDIGGTHSRFGFFEIQNDSPALLFSLHKKTNTINNFNEVFMDVISYAQENYNISVRHTCIAAPGVTTKNKDYSPVHGLFDIKSKQLKKKNNLLTALIVNDLSIIGYGIDLINQDNIIQLYGSASESKTLRSIIGIGTGLGSSILTWNEQKQVYIPQPGEAGLLEFAPHNKLEYDLANHIKQMVDSRAVYWAAFASGSGVRRIYSMLKLSKEYDDTLNLDTHEPSVILTNPQDPLCKATIDLFLNLCGRFVRNYAFATLPYGGLYLVGGMISNNSKLFSDSFAKEYYNCPAGLQKILENIPLYIITDSTIGMYGAMRCLLLELEEQKK